MKSCIYIIFDVQTMYFIIFRSNKLRSYCSVISHNTDIFKKSIFKKQTLKSRHYQKGTK